MALLRERMEELLVVLGGIIPNLDIPQMKARGVAEVFQPGASMESIVTFIRSHVRQAA
jgi:methylmalonyl-CoA mutase C-terminal domain/subunit